MLYYPNWGTPKIANDPFTLQSLIAWLERQPAGKRYWYISAENCILAQYFREFGYPKAVIAGSTWQPHGWGSKSIPLPNSFIRAAHGNRNGIKEWFGLRPTFGGALSRVRSL